MERSSRSARRLILTAFAAWLGFAGFVVPGLIALAYRGSAPEFLNRLISGQSTISLTDYLRSWWTLSAWITVALLAAGGLFRASPWLLAKLPPRDTSMSSADLLKAGLWCGLLAGYLEALGVHIHPLLRGFPAWEYSQHVWWMSPIANGLSFVVLAALIAAIVRLVPPLKNDWVTLPLLFLVVWEVFLTVALPVVSPGARIVLSIGAAIQCTRVALRGRNLGTLIARTTPFLAGGVLVLFAAQSGGSAAIEAFRTRRLNPAPGSAPNVLVLMLDTVRAASMGLYGSDRNTTPNIDAFAGESIVFDRAIATSPWTLPSHGSVFTGRWHYEMTGNIYFAHDASYPTLPELLSERGYRTAAFFGNTFYGDRFFGLDRGFLHYEVDPASLATLRENALLTRRLGEYVRAWRDDHQLPVRKTAAELNVSLLSWIGGNQDRPFFAFVNYFDAHDPYIPPEPWSRTFAREGAKAWVDPGTRRYGAEEMADLEDTYDSSLAYLDHHIGELLSELRASGRLDNTIIILLGDHGEEFGEHDTWGHGNSLYAQVVHVPLLVRAPGTVVDARRIGRPVSIRDVGQTVFDLTGLGAVEGFPGESLAPGAESRRLAGANPSPPILSELFADEGGSAEWYPNFFGAMRSVVLDDMHYIRRGDGREEMFDIVRDPLEESDLVQSQVPEDQAALARARMFVDSLLQEPIAVRGLGETAAIGARLRGR